MAGDEVVQLYLTDEKASTPRPVRQLEGFKRVHLAAGESRTLEFTLKAEQLSLINNREERVIEPGWFTLAVGGMQPGSSEAVAGGPGRVIIARFRLTGKETKVAE
jgi:beta-glucosidase